MAFSISFVFRASDKYSRQITSMAKASKFLREELNRLSAAAKHIDKVGTSFTNLSRAAHFSGRQFKSLGNDVSSANYRLRASMGTLRIFTNTVNNSTKAVLNQRAAFRSVNGYAPKVPRLPNSINNPAYRRAAVGGLNALSNNKMQLLGGAAAFLAPGVLASRQAADFETSFSNVRKVASDNLNAASLQQLSKNILGISARSPVKATELTDITAALAGAGVGDGLGQAGGVKELTRFTELIMQTATAFDMATGDVADKVVSLRQVFDLSSDGVRNLADQINYLDNKTSAKAKDILEITARIAGTAKTSGFKANEIAAFATTIKQVGAKTSVGGRALQDVFQTFAAGGGNTKTSVAAIQAVTGKSIKEFTKDYQNKPLETTIAFLKRIKVLGKDANRVLGDTFGKQYASPIALLADKVGLLEQNLQLVNSRAAKGSVLREYEQRTATFAAQLEILNNKLFAIGATIGGVINQDLGKLLKIINPIVESVSDWVQANPRLAASLFELSTGIGLVLGSLAGIGFLNSFIKALSQIPGVSSLAINSLGNFKTSLSGILGIIRVGGPWVLGFTAAAAAVKLLYDHNEDFRNSVNKTSLAASNFANSGLQDIITQMGKVSAATSLAISRFEDFGIANGLQIKKGALNDALSNSPLSLGKDLSNFSSFLVDQSQNALRDSSIRNYGALGAPSVGNVNGSPVSISTFTPGLGAPTLTPTFNFTISVDQTGKPTVNPLPGTPHSKVNLNTGKQGPK